MKFKSLYMKHSKITTIVTAVAVMSLVSQGAERVYLDDSWTTVQNFSIR